MTKYSCYEHSQPNEAPIILPQPDELASDLAALLTWRTEFTKQGSAKPTVVPQPSPQPAKQKATATPMLPPGAIPVQRPADS
jgi:hypothetical protein